MDLPSTDLFATGGAAAPGARPRVKLEKDAGTAGGGFGNDLLGAAAGALGLAAAQPDPLTDSLAEAFVTQLAAPGVATCLLRFLPRADFPALAAGDPLTLKLAAGGEPEPVFTGLVARITGARGGVLDVLLASPASRLARVRRNAGHESQSFADILNAWAGEVALATGRVDAGPDYAFFAVDDRLSLWDWAARLGRHAAVPVWVDAQGQLQAHAAAGQPVARFAYGETVLALDAHARDPETTAGTRVVGEGSAGRQGSEAWAWLAKDAEGTSAGAGALEHDGALRSLAAVTGAASAAPAADVVEVRVPGTPALDIAALFELSDCPRGEGDGRWQAVEVRHRFGVRTGFVTEVVGVAA